METTGILWGLLRLWGPVPHGGDLGIKAMTQPLEETQLQWRTLYYHLFTEIGALDINPKP